MSPRSTFRCRQISLALRRRSSYPLSRCLLESMTTFRSPTTSATRLSDFGLSTTSRELASAISRGFASLMDLRTLRLSLETFFVAPYASERE